MKVTVGEVMRDVRSFFPQEFSETEWTVREGRLTPGELLLEGDWIAIGGSLRNNGVWQVAEDGTIPGLRDERWHGRVWLLKPPQDFLDLCGEIADWAEEWNADGLRSERFGQYSVQRAVGPDGLPATWQEVFRARLAPWRHMFTEVNLYC